MFPGFVGSSPVSISVVPTVSRSTITLSSVYRLQLLPLFDRFGRYACDVCFSVPTSGGFYTSKISLECSHVTGDAEITLGSDWMTGCSATFCKDGAELEDPTTSSIASFLAGHYWSPSSDGKIICLTTTPLTNVRFLPDTHTLCNDSIDVDIILSKLNSCSNDPNFNQSAFFTAHGVDVDDAPLTREDVISHFLNGQCAGRKTTGCSEVARDIRSPIKMALIVTEAIVISCEHERISLNELRTCCSAIGLTTTQRPEYTVLAHKLKTRCNALRPLLNCDGLDTILCGVETLGKQSLQHLSTQHNLSTNPEHDTDSMKTTVVDHITSGECQASSSGLCTSIDDEYHESTSGAKANGDLETYILQLAAKKKTLSKKALRRVLKSRGIAFDNNENVGELRRHLRSHVTRLRKGKQPEWSRNQRTELESKHDRCLNEIRDEWPQSAPMNLKEDCVRNFRTATSSDGLRQFTCACCAESVNLSDRKVRRLGEIDLDLMRDRTDRVFDKSCIPPEPPFTMGPLANLMINPDGVTPESAETEISLQLCVRCDSSLQKGKLPRLAIANLNVLGSVPPEMKNMTMVEEMLVTRCRAKCCIVKLQDHRTNVSLPSSQRAIKGNIIVYPQRVEGLANMLPPPVDDVIHPICVLFVGQTLPTRSWLKDKAYPLVVRREVVRQNLVWLKAHNPLYKDIEIDETRLQALPVDGLLDYNIEHIPSSDHLEALESRYDMNLSEGNTDETPPDEPSRIEFSNVVITDVDAHAPANDLKAAAFRHFKRGGGFLAVPHEPAPVNEFFNPSLLPMLYPTLFPYGIGGIEDRRRTVAISFENHIKHLLSLADRRFQEHYSFLFVAFNIIQRRKLLLHTSLKVKRSKFRSWADKFKSISPTAIESLVAKSSDGKYPMAQNDEERNVLELMRDVNTVNSHIPGSAAARVNMRNEIRALTMKVGLPSFFITVNPADTRNPIVRFLAGNDVDVDALLPEQVPNPWEQSILIAKNPVIAARFFDIYLKAFVSTVLGYDMTGKNLTGGVLGLVKAHYGCVEAQGRGTLHCHMLVWLEGALNPNEIRDRVVKDGDSEWGRRLIRFLDDVILNVIPEDPDPELEIPSSVHHPCTVRGVDLNEPDPNLRLKSRLKDVHLLAKECQVHSHTKTCYKYQSAECRFGHDENNFREESGFDCETGELSLRCLEGLVNNFNVTMLEAIRCNMDIKFIGSGESAKAILYYITDYITKTDLKTHVAFAALELAVKKLGEFDPNADEVTLRAKRMLQKCAYAMVSHQELSAQQVAAYLVGGGDHYTSHSFRNIYWTSFEASINNERPSPECYKATNAESSQSSKKHEDIESSDDEEDSVAETSDDETDADGEDDVHIAFSRTGNIFECSSQVSNYRFRAKELDHLSVWEFVSTVDQVSKSQHRNDDQDDDDDDKSEDEDTSIEDRQGGAHELHPEHPEYLRKVQRVRKNPRKQFVPVPIGPALPRRDRPELRAKYSRLMLMLFKPWRKEANLRGDAAGWPEAFDEFAECCSKETRKVMDNMQILHECKDSKDSHFRTRRNHTVRSEKKTVQDRELDQLNMDEMLDHIGSVENYYSYAITESASHAMDCLSELESSGLFDVPRNAVTDLPNETERCPRFECPERIMLPDDKTLEDQWKSVYEKRRDEWKRKLTDAHAEPETMNSSANVIQPLVMTNVGASQVLPQAHSQIMEISPPLNVVPEANVSIEELVHDWTLNTEQARAFKIIASHSMESKPKPLRMYLGGPGGTGKSRIIHALTDFFKRKGQSRRLRLAAFTGVAAKNIGGTTLHTALSMSSSGKKSNANKTRANLVAMWNGIDYLFVDEVSTIGCGLLVDIHNALVSATGCTDLFGGISVIFAGDFSQLPPVLDTKLYTHLDHKKLHAETRAGQKTTFGKLLWRSVGTVVILTEQMRQRGEANKQFVSLLGRLREGVCTEDDFALLNSRLIATAGEDLSTDDWRGAPIVVSENVVKDAINTRATLAFAERTRQTVQWFDATDTYRGAKIDDPRVREYLLAQPSGKTGQRLGKLPIALGMPVIINQNFDVGGGLVNGSFGYLRDYRFQTDEDGVRTLTSCIVEIPDLTCEPLPHLPPRHVAIVSDTVEMRSIVHPASGRSCTMKRFQVPLTPGFAITAHKAQGLTLPHVIVDLAGCRGTESPYVMVSRCPSLDGLLVMRPFPKSKITCRRSQEARNEFARLEVSRWQSIAIHGSLQEQESARVHLSSNDNDPSAAVARFFLDGGFRDLGRVGNLVEQLQDDDEGEYEFVSLCPPSVLTFLTSDRYFQTSTSS